MRFLPAILMACSLAAAPPPSQPPSLAGVWDVTVTSTEDCTCTESPVGESHTFHWDIESREDGTVQVTVEGQTSFPVMAGRWIPDSRTLILSGYWTPDEGACWYKLTLGKDGALQGIRRYVSGDQSPDQRPCFVDYRVFGKRSSGVKQAGIRLVQ